MSRLRQCTFCGRTGSRAFVSLDGERVICKYATACRLRRDRALPPRMRKEAHA